MNLDNLKPGPELDKLVAEKVMGYIVGKYPFKREAFAVASSQRAIRKAHANGIDFWEWDDEGNAEFCCELPCYSTKIVDAWQVVKKIMDKGFEFHLSSPGRESKVWNAHFVKKVKILPDVPVETRHYYAYCDPPELAICIAALKATGNETR